MKGGLNELDSIHIGTQKRERREPEAAYNWRCSNEY